jgi:hypothetical protein
MRPRSAVPGPARVRARVTVLLLALGCVYLLTSSLATRPGRGSGTRARRGGPLDEELSPRVVEQDVVPHQAELDAATELEAAAAVPSPPPSPPPLLSRPTKRWGQLLEEGLYHKSSGYVRVLPSRQQEDEWEFWQDRVLHEYPNGAWAASSGAPRRAYGVLVSLTPHLSSSQNRLPPGLRQQFLQEAVPSQAAHHRPVQGWHDRAV